MTPLEILNEIISAKKRINPRLSMRAIASKMNVSSGRLSEILSGKRPLTETYIDKACMALKLSPEDISRLQKAYQLKKSDIEVDAGYGQVFSDEAISRLADWKPYAIMAFFQTSLYENITSYNLTQDQQIPLISRRLNLSEQDVAYFIKVLDELRMIQWQDDKWGPVYKEATTGYDIPSSAIQAGHVKDLNLAAQKLKDLSVYERDFSSVTFNMNARDLIKAKKMIRTFRRNLTRHFEKGSSKDSVFQLSIQLFPITNKEQ